MTADHVDLGIPGVTLAQRIGAGGNAVVYRARQPELDRVVVVKVLMVGDTAVTQRRFDRERRAMGRLSQAQGIAPVYDSGFTSGGQPYLIMPYYEHGSLQDRIELTGRLAGDDVRRIGIEIADAVQTAHDNGVLHRDLKPANILITRTGRADVADFGIAQILDDSGDRSQAITMTPLYTAPEIFDGARPSRTADVYSVGALLYALLNGRPAHADTTGSASVLSLMMKIKEQALPALPSDVPSGLVAVVAKAMHKDERKRYATAAELAAALRAADLTPPKRPRRARGLTTTDNHVLSSTPQSSEQGRTQQSRRLAGALLAAVLVVGVAVGAVIGLRMIGSEPDDVVSGPDASPISSPPISSPPGTTPVVAADVPKWSTGIDIAQVSIEAYSCGGVETSPGVLVGGGLVLAPQTIGSRPWRVAVIIDGVTIPATVRSFDDNLGLTSLQIEDATDDLASPHRARAVGGASVHVRTANGTEVTRDLLALPDGIFSVAASNVPLSAGSAVVNDAGSLIGVLNDATPPQVVPIVGSAIEGWKPVAANANCKDSGAAIGVDQLDQVASTHIRELLHMQRLTQAYAAEEWDVVRTFEPGKATLTNADFVTGWRPLEQSFLYPIDRKQIAADRVQWRLGLIGHERWSDTELTTLFCVTWEVDPSTGTVTQTNEDTVRVYGSQQGEPQRLGWVDPGRLLTKVTADC